MLQERKKVDSLARVPKSGEHCFRVGQELILVRVEPGDANQATMNYNVFAAYVQHFSFHRRTQRFSVTLTLL
jgi:hypothetical protein